MSRKKLRLSLKSDPIDVVYFDHLRFMQCCVPGNSLLVQNLPIGLQEVYLLEPISPRIFQTKFAKATTRVASKFKQAYNKHGATSICDEVK